VTGKLLYDLAVAGQFVRLGRIFSGIQIGVTALLLVGVLLILTIVFPAGIIGIVLWAAAIAIWAALLLKKGLRGRIVWLSAVTMMLVNFFLTNYFYYPLLKYQCGAVTGKFIRERAIPRERFIRWRVGDPLASIDFYARQVTHNFEDYPAPGAPGDYMLTTRRNLASLDSAGRPYTILLQGRYFKVSEVTPQFLNHKTRDSATTPYCVVLLK
jgi:hypothetical protein